MRAEEQPIQGLKARLHKANIYLTQRKESKPKDKQVQKLAMELGKRTKEADLLSNWSGETLCADGKSTRC